MSINTPSEMFEYIEEDKVTTEMGGTLEFDANEWTQHRSVSTRLEKVIESVASVFNQIRINEP